MTLQFTISFAWILFLIIFPGNYLSSSTTLVHEVACIDVTSLSDDGLKADICAVGLWTDISARLLKIPDLSTIHTEMLGGGKYDSYNIFVILNLFTMLHIGSYKHKTFNHLAGFINLSDM
jgi:hypothetical protein